MDKILTLIVVNDTVKEASLLDNFFDALRLQKQDLEGIQLVVLNQSKDRKHVLHCVRDLPVEIWQSDNDHVGDQAVWDIYRDLTRFQASIRGRWHGLIHKECVFSPGYLANLRAFLIERDPTICLGNMRRIGKIDSINFESSSCYVESAIIREYISRGDADKLGMALWTAPTCRWATWVSDEDFERVRRQRQWAEDIYFVSTLWMRLTRFYSLENRLLFQDVYDTMGRVYYILENHNIPLRLEWFDGGSIYHLHHQKHYHVFTPEFADYFAREPDRWVGTFWATDTYRIAARESQQTSENVALSRNSSLGTTTRFVEAFMSRHGDLLETIKACGRP